MKDEVTFWWAFAFLYFCFTIVICMFCVARAKIIESKWFNMILKFLRKCGIKKRSHESCQTNQGLCDQLDDYLHKKKPGFAVFIKGGWGSGKTYFINNCYESKSKHSCYVSLFGVKDKEEFEHRLWKGILFPEKQKLSLLFLYLLSDFLFLVIVLGLIWKLTDKYFYVIFLNLIKRCAFINDFLSNFVSFDFIPIIIKLFSLTILKWSIPAGIIILVWKFLHFNALNIFLHNRYLVLDDFERAEAPCDEVLSWINEYVEHVKCHTIIIGNEYEVIENINRKHMSGDNSNKQSKFADTSDVSNNKQPTYNVPLDFDSTFISEASIFVQHYLRIKEKTIRHEFQLAQNNRIVCIELLEKVKQYKPLLGKLINYEKSPEYTGEDDINILIEKVLKPINDYGVNYEQNIGETSLEKEIEKQPLHLINYRALERCFEEFEYYFSKVSSSETWKNFVSNKNYRYELLYLFFSLKYFNAVYSVEYFHDERIEHKEIDPTAKMQLEYLSVLHTYSLKKIMEEKRVNQFLSVFHAWSGELLFSVNIWIKFYNSIEVKHEVIIKELQNYYDSHIPTEPTLNERLREIDKLEDSQLDDLQKDIENEFLLPKIVSFNQFTLFVHQVCLAMQSKLFVYEQNILEDKLKKYIEIFFGQEKITNDLRDYEIYMGCKDNLDLYESELQPKDQSLWSNVLNLLKEKLKTVKHREKKTPFEEILSKIQEGANVFNEWYTQNHRIYTDYFSSDNPQKKSKELWDILKDDKFLPTDFQNIMDCFHSHISNRTPDMHMKSSEIEFWDNFISWAKIDKEHWEKKRINRNKHKIIERKIDTISTSLTKYKKDC